MDSAFRLETERLVLRPYTPDDLDSLVEIVCDAETMRYYPAPFTREAARAWIEDNLRRYREDGFGLWAMDSKETGEFLGNCGPAVRFADGVREVEMGWHVHRDHQGKGYATEAGTACCRWVFEELGRDRVISLIRPENVPSRRVAEKLGMQMEKETMYGSPHPLLHWVYALDRSGDGGLE